MHVYIRILCLKTSERDKVIYFGAFLLGATEQQAYDNCVVMVAALSSRQLSLADDMCRQFFFTVMTELSPSLPG